MQVLFLGRAPRTKETLPVFLKWRRVTRPPLVFRGLTGSQRTPGFWGVTASVRDILLTRATWAAAKDVEVIEKVQTTFIMARKSRVEMVICCGGGVEELGPAKSV